MNVLGSDALFRHRTPCGGTIFSITYWIYVINKLLFYGSGGTLVAHYSSLGTQI